MVRPGESISNAWKTNMTTGGLATMWAQEKGAHASMWRGYLVLTSQRLLFMQQVGMLTKTYMVKESIDLESLVNVSVQGVVKTLHVTFQSSGSSVNRIFHGTHGKGYFEIQNAIQSGRNARVMVMEEEKKRSRIQYVLDFSFLKTRLEKGGMIVSTIQCPSCSASLALPDAGTSTRCPHCGQSVVAQDIFNRMKGLIGDLP